ncbi:DUF1237 domain-containing protein [Seminavis robusta]|uniref:DUF1237 domain-containing protein n=1 Tax=Seminavis robusta TaxID=568900 RepID=A0A9N8E0B6_9STRA|nr:DUF1237 domain-containing protein [Seminavis robusta]|eukprot:Sro522_g159650.1 DUF1237 domain-containing protein (613) ;mRNA; f:50004-51954
MLNRRGRSSDNDLSEAPVSGAPSTNGSTGNNQKMPGGALKDVPILPKDRRKRRKEKLRKRKGGKTLRAWIPICFVIFYVLVVVASLSLLARYFLKSTSSTTTKTSTTTTSNHAAISTPSSLSSSGGRNNPILSAAYPKILRNPHEYPPLSQAAIDMCTRTLWHTIETTTIVLPDGETFIHTGDIDDLWLRDSAAQVHPLLVPLFGPNRTQALVALDPKLDRIVSGLIARTATYIRHDPYANAFRIDDSYIFSAAQKRMGRHDLISTWNYELDSFGFWMRMVYYYWKQSSSDTAKSVIFLERVQQAADIMVDVWKSEQQHENDQYPTGPLLDCLNCNKPYRYPGLARNGKGSPTNASSGLTWTGFRPSDDECQYGYLIPSNMLAVVALEYIVEMASAGGPWHNNNPALALKAQQLAHEIQNGIETHGIVNHPRHGKIYAYEVDGLGNSLLMDDANVPSLLSIPYLGYKHYDPQIYENTKRFIFSNDNPTFQSGSNAMTGPIQGYGSPHMKAAIAHNIWPMSLAVQGLTSSDTQEKAKLVETLVAASAGTGWMHESFDVRNPRKFTRSWFCWADSLFAELVLSITDQCPQLAHKYRVMEWRDTNLVEGGIYAED